MDNLCGNPVEIPKRSGGKRQLGIPTVADRIAQAVVVQTIEGNIEKVFHEDSYGYRLGKKGFGCHRKNKEEMLEV